MNRKEKPKILSVEEIRARLADRILTIVAAKTTLSVDTLYRLVHDDTRTPSYATVIKLSDYLSGDANG